MEVYPMVARILVALLVAALIAVPFEAPALVTLIPGNELALAAVAVTPATAVVVPTFLRFADLKARGIVDNRVTLDRWIATEGFPAGRLLGPNIRAWTTAEIADWLEARPTGRPARQRTDVAT
jgi:hypothetical protein